MMNAVGWEVEDLGLVLGSETFCMLLDNLLCLLKCRKRKS